LVAPRLPTLQRTFFERRQFDASWPTVQMPHRRALRRPGRFGLAKRAFEQVEQEETSVQRVLRRIAGLTLIVQVGAAGSMIAPAGADPAPQGGHRGDRRESVPFSTFNASLNRNSGGAFKAAVSTTTDPQIKAVAEIIQNAAPDVLLVNEFDFDETGESLRLFQDNYLSISQNGATPISYPCRFTAPSNTGVPSGFDLDNNRSVGGGNDAYGFGLFPGQFGMPCTRSTRSSSTTSGRSSTSSGGTCRARCSPMIPANPAQIDWYSPEELDVFRLSSKEPLGPAHRGRGHEGALPREPTRRRPCSTAPKTATARATTT
jgi:hypothetical protein